MENGIIGQLHEETKLLIQQCVTGDDYIKIFYALENLRKIRDDDFKAKIKSFKWEMFKPTHRMIELAMEDLYRKAARTAHSKPELIKPLRDFFLYPYKNSRARYDLIAALHDQESIELVFKTVDDQFKLDIDDDDIDKLCFYGLVEIAEVAGLKERVLKLVRNGFKRAIKIKEDDMVNDTILNLLGQLCVMLNDKEASPALYRAFKFAADENQDYEMNTVASRLAIYLTALDYGGSVKDIKHYIDYFMDSYEDEEFVVRACYAHWWFKKETNEALAFLNNPDKKKSLGLVAALLADLDEKRAITILESRLNDLANPVTKEVFKEAISRLKSQKEIPTNQERMIWMFGFISETQIALGDETDNIFIQRANAATLQDHGRVYEVDDATKSDM